MAVKDSPSETHKADEERRAQKPGGQQESNLEKSLEDTFPASDPPASSSPTQSVGWDVPEDQKKKG